MSAKFTKGPWSGSTGRANIGGHGHKCWLVGQKDGDVGCAVVILPDEDDTPEAQVEREATANLVAAAPLLYDMLSAVQWGLDYHQDYRCPVCGRLRGIGHEETCALNNALRAARGEG